MYKRLFQSWISKLNVLTRSSECSSTTSLDSLCRFFMILNPSHLYSSSLVLVFLLVSIYDLTEYLVKPEGNFIWRNLKKIDHYCLAIIKNWPMVTMGGRLTSWVFFFLLLNKLLKPDLYLIFKIEHQHNVPRYLSQPDRIIYMHISIWV